MSSNQRWVLGLTAAYALSFAVLLSRDLHVLPDGTRSPGTAAVIATAVMSSVPLPEAGIASGTNSMLRELGGVLGIAALASVFARHGVYRSPRAFIDGFTNALWVGVGLSALGVAAALLAPTRRRTAQASAASLVVAVEESHPAPDYDDFHITTGLRATRIVRTY